MMPFVIFLKKPAWIGAFQRVPLKEKYKVERDTKAHQKL
jgi:hypothetical protein